MKARTRKEFCRRIGEKRTELRPIVIGLENEEEKRHILFRSKNLKWTDFKDVSVVPDLTRKQRDLEEKMRKQAEEKNKQLTREEINNNVRWMVVGKRGEKRIIKGIERMERHPGQFRNEGLRGGDEWWGDPQGPSGGQQGRGPQRGPTGGQQGQGQQREGQTGEFTAGPDQFPPYDNNWRRDNTGRGGRGQPWRTGAGVGGVGRGGTNSNNSSGGGGGGGMEGGNGYNQGNGHDNRNGYNNRNNLDNGYNNGSSSNNGYNNENRNRGHSQQQENHQIREQSQHESSNGGRNGNEDDRRGRLASSNKRGRDLEVEEEEPARNRGRY